MKRTRILIVAGLTFFPAVILGKEPPPASFEGVLIASYNRAVLLTGIEWVDLCLWAPDLPTSKLTVIRIERNQDRIDALLADLAQPQSDEYGARRLAERIVVAVQGALAAHAGGGRVAGDVPAVRRPCRDTRRHHRFHHQAGYPGNTARYRHLLNV